MKLPLKIAFRYIFTLRSFHFITVISSISLVGITVGVAALICVMSIFNGFQEFTESQLIGFDPHIRVSAREGAWLNDAENYRPKIRSFPEVQAVTTMLQGRIIALRGTNMQVITINAVNPKEIDYVSGISKSIIIGKFVLEPRYSIPGIVLGSILSDRLKVLPGDTISLMSPTMIESSIKAFRKIGGVDVLVTGIFQTNAKEYDEIYGYVTGDVGRKLFTPPPGAAFTIDIRLKSIEKVQQFKKQLSKIFPKDVIIQTWFDLHKDLYNIMKFERLVAFIVLSLIIIIAVFNVLASLAMTVIEKRGDIGVLKALGATDSLIQKIYMFEGLIIGAISTVLGTILGLGLCFGQIKFGWFKLDTSKFLIETIPISIHVSDIIIVCIFSMLLSFLAALYPAKRAASTIIAQAIREE